MAAKFFMILEDKCGRLSYAPQNWLLQEDGKDIIYWPRKNQTILQKESDSTPILTGEDKWLVIHDKIKRKNLKSFRDAESEIEDMLAKSVTESDTDNEKPQQKKSVIPKYTLNKTPQTPPSALKNRSLYVQSPTSSHQHASNTPPSLIIKDNSGFIGISPMLMNTEIQGGPFDSQVRLLFFCY